MLSYANHPLKDRVYRSPGVSHRRADLSHCRPERYKKWTNERFTKAIDAVVKENFSVRRAALEFDVPISTLHDGLLGKF